MPRIDPALVPVLSDLSRGLRELGVDFCLVGGLAPELLLEARPRRMTNDADLVLAVDTLESFSRTKEQLAQYGFDSTKLPHRLRHREGGLVDLLPFSENLVPNGTLSLESGFIFNMAGFKHVAAHAVPVEIEAGLTIPVVPLSLYTLLKLVAFSDRQAPKDLAGVLHVLRHYDEDIDDRRYGLEHRGDSVPFEYTCAYLAGLDCQPFLEDSVRETCARVLDLLADPDEVTVAHVARENGIQLADERDRKDIHQHFHWYRLAAGL